MSLAKINNFANDDTDILAVQTTVDALYNNSYSLTEYDSTTVPAIAAGSKIEVNGSLYRAATEEAISTTDPVTSSTVADGTVYICMIPSVDASTCTAAFTATAPTWSDSKQGWYGTGDQANYKYIASCIKSSTNYTNKFYITKNETREKLICSLRVGTNSYGAVSGQLVHYGTIEFDNYSIYNSSTDRITIPFDGLYEIRANFTHGWSSNSGTYRDILMTVDFKLNGGSSYGFFALFANNYKADLGNQSVAGGKIIEMSADDYIDTFLTRSGTNISSSINYYNSGITITEI